MRRSMRVVLMIAAAAVLAALPVQSAEPQEPPSGCAASFEEGLGIVLDLGEGLAGAAEAEVADACMLPDLLFEDGTADPMTKPQRHRFCRCSCGGACQTSADCGGSPCDPFITCC